MGCSTLRLIIGPTFVKASLDMLPNSIHLIVYQWSRGANIASYLANFLPQTESTESGCLSVYVRQRRVCCGSQASVAITRLHLA